jgi:hypothetical protein
MKARGMTRAFAAYRGDWPTVRDFFLSHGFSQPREMLNFVLDLRDMPTPAAVLGNSCTPFAAADVPHVLKMAPDVFHVSAAELEKSLLHNAHFGPNSLFVLRKEGKPSAVGIGIANGGYANPHQLDADMPCFRLGAFGTEGLTTKRVNGLFSFVTSDPRDVSRVGLDLLGHAAYGLSDTNVETFAAQVASDVPHLVRFYQQVFRKQGSFPIFEKVLS